MSFFFSLLAMKVLEPKMLGPVEPRVWLMGTEAFERTMEHHAGMKALWETKWKLPVSYVLHLGLRS